MVNPTAMADTFESKAELVSARVSRVKTLDEAFAYTVAVSLYTSDAADE